MEVPQAIRNVFGEDVKLHPITKRPIEQGSGALTINEQVLVHLATVEREEGKDVADAMRHKMRAQADMTAANTELAEVQHHHEGSI